MLYPDIEVAHDLCRKHLEDIALRTDRGAPAADEEQAEDDDLAALFGALSDERTNDQEQVPDVEELLGYVAGRAAATDLRQVPHAPLPAVCQAGFLPLYHVCLRLRHPVLPPRPTTPRSFKWQTRTAPCPPPTVESAGRVFYGQRFSITGAYGEMSRALEQLKPILEMQVNSAMPFSTQLSPDKRMIDFLFGLDPCVPTRITAASFPPWI